MSKATRAHRGLNPPAERMYASPDTVQRLERGDPGVRIGIIAAALLVLGMERQLEELAVIERDRAGVRESEEHLPKRVNSTCASHASVTRTSRVGHASRKEIAPHSTLLTPNRLSASAGQILPSCAPARPGPIPLAS